MAGPSFNQMMMLAGLGVAGIVAYELWVNQGSIQAAIQNALNPINPYQQQGYYCPGGGVPSPQGLCPNGQPAINQSQFNQLASMGGGCSDGSIVNPATGRCANGSIPMPTGYGQGGLGYPQSSVCNDGSQPNPYNGLCANGSVPTSVQTGVPNAMVSPYGAPSSVYQTITGGLGVPGGTTFTDPTTGQIYDPTTAQLLTPGGSYTTPSLASPYSSIFPTLAPLAGPGTFQPQTQTQTQTQTQPDPSGQVPTSTAPTPTTITTPSPSTQPITQTSPAPAPVVTPSPAPAPITPATVPPPVTTVTPKPLTLGGLGGQPGRSGYAGFASEGSMIAAQAHRDVPRDRSRASVTNYSTVRPRGGDSPITSEIFNRRFYTSQPIYVSGIR